MLSLAPGLARAGGFEVPDQSAVAGATGGTGTARRGDPSSAWYQPAETADGRGFRGGLGLLLAFPTITALGLEEPRQSATTELAVSPPPHLHLSYSENEWSIGMYVGVSHGSSVQWPEGWWGRFEAMQTGILGIRAQPFFALRLGGEHGLIEGFPDIRVSIGAHVDTVRLEQQRMLDFIDQEGRVHLLLWGAGVGGDASVYYQATPELSFGVTYKSRTWMRLNGDADFTVPDPFVGRAPDQRASAELVIPDRLVFGAGWQDALFGVWADIGVTFWSVRDRTRVDFEREATRDIDTPVSWHDAVALRLGAAVHPIPELHARAGLFFDQEVGPADTPPRRRTWGAWGSRSASASTSRGSSARTSPTPMSPSCRASRRASTRRSRATRGRCTWSGSRSGSWWTRPRQRVRLPRSRPGPTPRRPR